MKTTTTITSTVSAARARHLVGYRHFAWILIGAAFLPEGADAQETTAELYGEFRYAFDYASDGDAWRWAATNNASRFGFRGSSTERGLTGFVDLQSGVSVDSETGGITFPQRFYVAGLRGAFGSLALGRQNLAYKAVGIRIDPFYDTSTLSVTGAVPANGLYAGASFGLSVLNNGFADRTLAYTSPSISGVVANASLSLDSESDHDYAVGAAFRQGGLEVGVQHYDPDSGGSLAQAHGVERGTRGHVSYAAGSIWIVAGSYEKLSAVGGGEQDLLYLSGRYSVTPRTSFAASAGHVSGDGVQPVQGTAVHGGVFYTVVPQAQLHLLASYLNVEEGDPRLNVAVGLISRFSLTR